MRLCFFALFLIACAFSAAEAQRVYYQSGFPPAPGRHLFLANRQRTRFANGFSARLQQKTDETDEQDTPTPTNTGLGIGVANGDESSSGDVESNDNSIDDSTVPKGDSDTTLSSKSPTKSSTASPLDNSSEEEGSTGDTGSTDSPSSETGSKDESTTDNSNDSAEDAGETSTSSPADEGDSEVENKSGGGSKKTTQGGSNHGSSKGHDDGSYDHGDHGDTIDWLKDAIQGEPGKDYPIYGEIPQTSFRCSDQKLPGYYGDTMARCQVFHICQADGRMDSFLCPNGTIFAQNYFVCVWWHDFDCSTTESFYNLNENLYKPGKGIDGSDVLISPLDMMNGVVMGSLTPMMDGVDSSDETSTNSIDGGSNDAIDESNEGDKLNSKTNNDMGFTNNMGPMNNFNTPSSNNNGLRTKTNPFKTNLKGKTDMNSPTAGGMMTILMNGKTNLNKNGGGNTKTSVKTTTPPTLDETTSSDEDSDNMINSEPSSTEFPLLNTSEKPVTEDSSTTDSEENNIDNAQEDSDSQHNIEDNEISLDKKTPTTESTTNLVPSDNSITENPAAEEVTDTPIEGGTTSDEDSGKDEPTSTDEDSTGKQDVQITEKDDSKNSARSSRTRFLAYRPRLKSKQLSRVRVNAKKARFLPVLSSRNGVTRRLVVSNSLSNKKSSKRLKAVSNNKRSNSVRRKSSRSSKRGNKRSSQLRLRKKSSNRNSKKASSSKKKNLKRANNRKQSRSSSRRRGGSRRSRSQRRTNRRLIVLRNNPIRKHHN